jgi:hypothetical protein
MMTSPGLFSRGFRIVITAVAIGLTTATLSTPALAQTTPVISAGDAALAPAPAVEWKVQAKGGLLLTSGNSQTTNGTFGISASRKQGGNKLTLDGAINYGRSNVLTPVVDTTTMPSTVTALNRQGITSTNNWNSKGRYDRFLTPNNTAFVTALAAADKIAGKSFYGGGQVGYSRQVIKDDKNLLVAELGYDLSYERYVESPGKTLDPVSIHSARLFIGETLKLSPATGVTASVEALFNLNREGAAVKVDTAEKGVDAFKDTRVIGKVGLTTTLVKSLSFAFGFTLRYDQNPAPRALPGSTPAGVGYAPDYNPFSDKVDTLAEAALIYTFL